MYLSKIELFGFKSFAHRVRITFDKGLTAIVGPNGCGKTNVVDAIRWVLGEQKSSLLRSAKMENIIFNGSRKLKPLSMTEVSITIENTRNILPTEYTEITVTRRLYRNGESDYLLNQVPCRLKDIIDLFADTGMGSDAYSVIELKMIEEIISNKSDERLRLFEEAAGITRYKQRRKQTFRQLQNTTRDLERVDDVLLEVSKKVRSLKSQVRKAEQYHELKASLRELDLTLGKLKLEEYFDRLQPLKKEILEREKVVQEVTTTIATHDSSLQELEREQLEQEHLLSEAQKDLNEKNNAFHALEKALLQMQEQEKNLRDNIVRITEAINEKQLQTRELEKTQTQLSEQLAPLEEDLKAQQNELQTLKKEQESMQNVLSLSKEELQKVRQSISEHRNVASVLEVSRQKLETTQDHLKSTIERIAGYREELLKIDADAIPARNRILELIESQKTLIASEKKELHSLKKHQHELGEQLEAKKELLLNLRSRRDFLNNKVLLANSILDNYEGLPEGIAWLENGKKGKPGYGCLSDLISLDDIHRKAVNAALGDSLGYYVCKSLQEAKAGIRSLFDAGKGKVSFLVLDLVETPPTPESLDIDGAVSIRNILNIPQELENAVSLLLRHCYIAEDLETAEKLALKNSGCTFVTPEGEKFGGSGVVFGGSPIENEGLRLGKKAERERLLEETDTLQKEIQSEETALRSLEQKLLQLPVGEKEQTIASLESELLNHEKKLARVDIEHSSRKKDRSRAEKEEAEARESMNSAMAELDALLPEISLHEQQQSRLDETLKQTHIRLTANEEILDNLEKELKQREDRYKDRQLESEKLRLRIQSCQENRKSLLQETEKLRSEIQKTERSLVLITENITRHREELEESVVSTGSEQQQLNELETRYNECKIRNQEKRNVLRELRRKHEVEMQIHGELQRQAAEFEKSMDNLLTSLNTRYNCNIDEIEITVPEQFNRDASQERLDAIKTKIDDFGAVNDLALEEYQEEKERLDFLTSQKQDLVDAETQLRATIEEINKTALNRLEETFFAVKNNFVRIFRELFEETDEADLLITTEDDPLEAHIEIIARPRGKKPLSIEQLSGGEKALTALALLFAIYLVKPSPFCILDEVDAPLDDANIGRFIKLLKKFENNTQFIIVTHNKKTMASSQALYGVTMEEEGVSKLIPVKLGKTQKEELSSDDA